jgi:hypothetical protein
MDEGVFFISAIKNSCLMPAPGSVYMVLPLRYSRNTINLVEVRLPESTPVAW